MSRYRRAPRTPSPISGLLVAVIVGVVLISVIGTVFVLARPVWGKFEDNFDNVVSSLGISDISTQWTKTTSTINGLWWVVPVMVAVMIIWYVWMKSQESDYITVGVYR